MTTAVLPAQDSPPQSPRLLDQFRAAARVAAQPEPLIEHLANWVTSFIIIHGKPHQREMEAAVCDAFLRHVVQTRKDPARGAWRCGGLSVSGSKGR